MRDQPLSAVILAAGLGTRMRSRTPKVLHPVGGKPIIDHVLDACTQAGIRRIVAVVNSRQLELVSHIGGRSEVADCRPRNGALLVELRLCEQCAAANEGIPVKSHTPINELLTNFVMAHSGLQKEIGAACENCGITWAEFRQSGLLGCEHDYTLYERDLTPLTVSQ